MNLGRGVGRPAIGYFSDGVGRINMASIMSLICGVLCLAMWIPAKDYGALLAFSLFGGVTGTFWTASPLCKPSIIISNIYPPGRRPRRHRSRRPPRLALLPNNDVDGPRLPSSLRRPNCPPTAQTWPSKRLPQRATPRRLHVPRGRRILLPAKNMEDPAAR